MWFHFIAQLSFVSVQYTSSPSFHSFKSFTSWSSMCAPWSLMCAYRHSSYWFLYLLCCFNNLSFSSEELLLFRLLITFTFFGSSGKWKTSSISYRQLLSPEVRWRNNRQEYKHKRWPTENEQLSSTMGRISLDTLPNNLKRVRCVTGNMAMCNIF